MSRTRTAASALLPLGEAWTRSVTSVLGQILTACTAELERIEARAVELLAELTPLSSVELLARWEAALGVPASTRYAELDDRQLAAAARLVPPEDASLASLGAACAELGYAPTFIEHGLFRVDSSACGDPLNADAWVHVLDVEVERGDNDAALRALLADREQAHVLTRLQWQEAA